MNNPSYSARKHATEPGSLRDKLNWLRGFSQERPSDPRLSTWGAKHLSIEEAQIDEWCTRAWWGVAAGELTRIYLYDQQKRDEALDLLRVADWAPVDTALAQDGVIMAAAHIGPPKFLMNVLIDRYEQAMVLTNMKDMPDWLPSVNNNLFDPLMTADRSMALIKSALHLRSGGLLFAAPDGAYSATHIEVDCYNRIWRFSTGMPLLARRLNLKSFSAFILWEGNEMVLHTAPIVVEDHKNTEEEWSRNWIEEYWSGIAKIIASSPENLRFLASPFRKELGT